MTSKSNELAHCFSMNGCRQWLQMSLFQCCIAAVILSGTLGCGVYSFTGAVVDPRIASYSIDQFSNLASYVSPTLSNTLTEKMRDKFNSNTRLNQLPRNGDLHFAGAIVQYNVQPAASGAGDQAALNRLTAGIRVECSNKITRKTWVQTFTTFVDFDRNTNLNDVEPQLIDEITTRLVDDIFNRAFANW